MTDAAQDAIHELRDECTCNGDDAIDTLEAEITALRAENDALRKARHARDLAVARAMMEAAARESYRFFANATEQELDEQLAANMADLTDGTNRLAEMHADKILALDAAQIVKDMEGKK